MSIFSPRRYQQPYLPVERDRWLIRVLTAIERTIKGWLFGCRMCGNCILQETAFVCPMTCPKGLRNGLCGEASAEHCAVDPTRPCTWYLIYSRAEWLGRLEKLMEINAPIDGSRAGHEAWINFVSFWSKRKQGPNLLDIVFTPRKFIEEWDQLLYEHRQPEWWQGDDQYHPPQYDQPVSKLEADLRTRQFITTAEIEQPYDVSPERIATKAKLLKGHVTSVNFSDNAYAMSQMSSVASSKLCIEAGLEPVLQLQARDRTRIAIQSEALGASGMGIRNILCLGGNFHELDLTPATTPHQFDIDVVQMLWILRRMRDEGKLLDGREIEHRPQLFLGAAGSPFAAPPKYDAIRVEKKVNAGAQFIKTQMIFDYDRFTDWLDALDQRNLLDKVYILAGVSFLKEASEAHQFLNEPGISMTPEIIKRMDAAYEKDKLALNSSDGCRRSNKNQIDEGHAIALELIDKLKQTPGIHGIHLMAGGQEEIVPRIVEIANLRNGDELGKAIKNKTDLHKCL